VEFFSHPFFVQAMNEENSGGWRDFDDCEEGSMNNTSPKIPDCAYSSSFAKKLCCEIGFSESRQGNVPYA
jgi:hypothetical protein